MKQCAIVGLKYDKNNDNINKVYIKINMLLLFKCNKKKKKKV